MHRRRGTEWFDLRLPLSQRRTKVNIFKNAGFGDEAHLPESYSVVLIESQRFPHDKVCGDVVTPLAQKHLEEMGVLQQIVLEKEGRWVPRK